VDDDGELRTVTQMEEMVARTHERAAELYETWLEQRGAATAATLRGRARHHRRMADEARSVRRLVARSLQGFETRLAARVPAAGKARTLTVLAGMEHLRRLLDRRIEETVATGRREGASWAEIASALHVTRQTAHERYRNRPESQGSLTTGVAPPAERE
jgi:hypothetical protein